MQSSYIYTDVKAVTIQPYTRMHAKLYIYLYFLKIHPFDISSFMKFRFKTVNTCGNYSKGNIPSCANEQGK